MKMIIALIGAILTVVSATGAFGQSSPGIYYGFAPTAAQWNSYFAAKQDVLGYVPLNKAGDVMLGRLTTWPSSASASGLRVSVGDAPTDPTNGDVWMTINGMYYRANNATFGPVFGPTNFAASYPLSLATVGALTTISLGFDSNFSLIGNQLALSISGLALGSPTGGQEGAGTINVSGSYYVNGAPLNFSNLAGSISGTQIPNSTITNAMLANAAAWSFKCNNTASAATPGDCTIDGLTSKTSPTGSDEIAIWDAATSTMKKSTVAAAVGSVGVSSIGGTTGAISLGSNLTMSGQTIKFGSGAVVGHAISMPSTVNTDGAANMPGFTNALPTQTEGTQFTTLVYTPKSATNTCVLRFVAQVAFSVAGVVQAAVFQDATANAIATAMMSNFAVPNAPIPLQDTISFACGTTSATTFKLRFGADRAGTSTINGVNGAQIGGGAFTSGIEITEYAQ